MNRFARLDRDVAERVPSARAPASAPVVAISDDAAMMRDAANLTRDLNQPDAKIYWVDLIGSSALGYAATALAILTTSNRVMLAAALVAILALYRSGSFIHELTHLKRGALRGFRLAWNLVLGIPMLIPSFLYEGVHNQHHAKRYYGTVHDPEYLPLALMRPWTLPMFLIAAALAPIGLLFRFAVLAPASLFSRRLRRVVVERYSGLQINPRFRRPAPEGEFRRDWIWLEAACSLWAIGFIALAATGTIAPRTTAILMGIASGAMFLNQVRTLVAHLWENDGEAMSVTAQYLDSVNVPPPATLPALWAPVGLRYHALHHLLPGVPYHNLAEAHRRLCASLDESSPYHRSSHRGLTPLVRRLGASTLTNRRFSS